MVGPPPHSPKSSSASLQVPKSSKTFHFGSQASAAPATAKPDPVDTLTAKVKKHLRETERKTIIYDLDLGNAPTINKDMISRKVTIALHEKAKEGNHNWAISDASEMINDTLSCSQLEFLGSGTRKFYNNRDKTDKQNGKMCTVPVRMDFKNKETRVQAESSLRSICDALPLIRMLTLYVAVTGI